MSGESSSQSEISDEKYASKIEVEAHPECSSTPVIDPESKERVASIAKRQQITPDRYEGAIWSLSRRKNPPQPSSQNSIQPDEQPAATLIPDTSLLDHQRYIIRICRAFIMYGAPTHRLETYMQRTADALDLHLQAFYLPNCMIISFDDDGNSNTTRRSLDVQIVTCVQALNLAKLSDAHRIYKDVIHRRTNAKEATALLDELFVQEEQHPRWLRVLMYGLASACIGPVSYGARPVDLPLIFLLGSLVGLLDLVVTAKSVLYGCIFEMTSAILVSFVARALGSFQWGSDGNSFCFSAVAQASLVLILPGFTMASSALELQSRMMISGAVRLVYGIIYTLFLAFGFIVGITVYGAIDSNATSATTCDSSWSDNTTPFWWQVIFVVPFTFCYVVVNQAKWKQIPAMLFITMAGWLVNYFSAQRFPTVQSFPNALGALTVGILSNLYSRLAHGLAIVVMHPAIFILVPGSFAASGSLIEGLNSANEVIQQQGSQSAGVADGLRNTSALYAGYAMVEIAIGITAGLSVSTLLVYPALKKVGGSGLFSY